MDKLRENERNDADVLYFNITTHFPFGYQVSPSNFNAGRPKAALLFLVLHGCSFINLFVVC